MAKPTDSGQHTVPAHSVTPAAPVAPTDWIAQAQSSPTRANMAKAILQGMGAPISASNVAFLMAIMQHEGTSAGYNPLASVQSAPGTTNFNSVGVKNYPDVKTAVDAYVTQWQREWPTWVQALKSDQAGTISGTDPGWTKYSGGNPQYGQTTLSYYHHLLGTPDTSTPIGTGSGSVLDTSSGTVNADHSQYAWLLSDPEVGAILRKDAATPMSQQEFDYELQQTNWWRQNSSTARAWQVTVHNDPASARDTIAQNVTQIETLANSLGVKLSSFQELAFANQMQMFGWNTDQLTKAITDGVNFTGKDAGKAGLGEAQIRQTAADYGIKLSDASVAQYQKQTLAGQLDLNTLRGNFQQQASVLFPSAAPLLQQGHTVRQILDPYLTSAANLLGTDTTQFDISDPKWVAPLQARDGKGQLGQMSLADWNHKVMTDQAYGYDHTTNARNDAFNVASSLAQTFGVMT